MVIGYLTKVSSIGLYIAIHPRTHIPSTHPIRMKPTPSKPFTIPATILIPSFQPYRLLLMPTPKSTHFPTKPPLPMKPLHSACPRGNRLPNMGRTI